MIVGVYVGSVVTAIDCYATGCGFDLCSIYADLCIFAVFVERENDPFRTIILYFTMAIPTIKLLCNTVEYL